MPQAGEVTLAEAGVTRFARDGGFQGAKVSLAPPRKWVVALLRLDEPAGVEADPLGSEAIWKNGRVVGAVASGGYGYGVGAFLAWAYLEPALALPGTELELNVAGRPRRATIIAEAVWDPANERPRQDGLLAIE